MATVAAFWVAPSPPPSPTPVTVSGPDTVWWFNSQTPSGYSTSITLSSSAGSSTTWNVTQGQDKVSLSPTSGAQTTVTSTGTAFSSSSGDIVITATAGGYIPASFPITSRKPASLYRYNTRTGCNSTWGYLTFISYTIWDQLNATLPSSVPVNEFWSTNVVPDYVGTDWIRGQAKADTSDGSGDFADMIGGESAGYTPPATCDGNSTAVQHWGQQWYIGSLTPGTGVLVQADTLQKYIGYADHLYQ